MLCLAYCCYKMQNRPLREHCIFINYYCLLVVYYYKLLVLVFTMVYVVIVYAITTSHVSFAIVFNSAYVLLW